MLAVCVHMCVCECSEDEGGRHGAKNSIFKEEFFFKKKLLGLLEKGEVKG